jgi:DNA-binding MarR family transcriptional regulator
MPPQYFNQNITLLQWKILKCIATHDNSDYKGTANELDRSRPTIYESVKPLIKKGYVDATKEDHALRNSRVILRLTRKGKDYVGTKKYLGDTLISNSDILSSETDPVVLEYLQILRRANDSNLLEVMMEELSYYLHSAPIADKKESVKSEYVVSAVCEAFFQGLKEIAQNPDYDLTKLFTSTTIMWLNNIYSHENKNYMKDYFQRIAQNCETIVKGITKTLHN